MTHHRPVGSMQQGQLQHGPTALSRSYLCQPTTNVASQVPAVGDRLRGPRPQGTPSEVVAGQEVTRAEGLVMAMALLQPVVCTCVCLSVCLSVVKLCMHKRLGKQVSHPPVLHLMCAHSICKSDYAQLSDVPLIAMSRELLPCGVMVQMLKILMKPYGTMPCDFPDSWRQIAWHGTMLPIHFVIVSHHSVLS